MLAAFALLVVCRLPGAWVHGRFQDEEATVFLAYAWHFPWYEALFRPFAGYWNLGATSTTVAVAELVRGGILPLERAPYFTMLIALAFQLVPAVLVLTGSAPWSRSRVATIAALLAIAIMPATEEVFFNVLHIQFHLALGVALILAMDVPSGRGAKIGYALILLLAPLCGAGAIVMLPLFALRALVDRDRRRAGQLAVLAAGSALQLLLFYSSSALRGLGFDPASIAAAMLVRLVALPLMGTNLAGSVGGAIYSSQVAGSMDWWWFVAEAALLFGVLIVVAARRRDAAVWLTLSGLSMAVVSLGFGMVTGVRYRQFNLVRVIDGERYNFVPLVLLALALIVLAMRPAFRGRLLCAALVVVVLLNGALYYPKPAADYAHGPSWPEEVGAWRRDHGHPLAVWPAPWAADLSDETHACTPPNIRRPQLAEPRYCESGWITRYFYPEPERPAGLDSSHGSVETRSGKPLPKRIGDDRQARAP